MLLALCLPAFATIVLVIVTDDLGADKVAGFTDPASPADYLPATPTLDDLQAGGITFTDAWANPVCSPTRAGLHTGEPAYVHGIGYPLGPEDEGLDDATWLTLGEGAQAAGYATAAFGKWHIGAEGSGGTTDWELNAASPPETRMEQPHPVLFGFDTYVGDLDGIMADYDSWTRVTYPGSSGVGSTDLDWDTDPVEDVIVDEAGAWIDAQGAGSWFAMVNFYAPHSEGASGPFDAGELYDTCLGDPCVDAGTCPDLNGDGDTADDVARLVYRELVECMDDRVETLLAGIATSVLEDTIIVFMGDNGTPEDVLEGDYADAGARPKNGKGSVYETGVRVPMIVTDGESWLDVINGRAISSDVYPNPGDTYEGPVSTGHIHDTVLSWIDGPPMYMTTFSRDLSSALAAGTVIRLPARRCSTWTEVYDTPSVDDAAAACRSGNWKLVMDVESGGTCVVRELYDLSSDPHEWTDEAAANPAIVDQLWADVLAKGVGWLPTSVCP